MYDIILSLVHNIALLIALAAAYQVCGGRLKQNSLSFKIVSGLLLGTVGLIGMVTPVYFSPGIIFDGRSIILSIGGLFGGPIVAFIAAVMCGAYRLYLGGGGAVGGVGVILEASVIGVFFYYWRRRNIQSINVVYLLGFGMIVHILMLAFLLVLLPDGAGYEVLRRLGLPILTIYPVATMLICQIFLDYEKQILDRKALYESEARYRNLVDNVSEMIYVAQDEMIKFITPSVTRLTGYSFKELSEQPFIHMVHPEDRILVLEQHRRRLSGICISSSRPYRVIFKSGDIRWVSVSAALIEWEGKPATLNFMTDVTESREAQEAIELSYNRLKCMSSSNIVGIILADRGGNLLEVNDYYLNILGFTRSEFEAGNVRWDERTPPEYLPADWKALEELRERGVCTPYEKEYIRKDGSHIWVFLAGTLVPGPEEHFLAFILDITGRKQAEAEKERLMAAIEQACEIIVVTDSNGTIQYVNPAFKTVTGYSREEAMGQNPRILKSGQHDEAFYRELWNTISSGRIWKGRLVNRRKDGSFYTEEASISPVCNISGQIVNYVGVKRDITEHLRLEEQFLQAQKMEAVGRLAGGVAHDFNNMLGVILGHAEMAMEDIEPGQPFFNEFQRIHHAAERSAELTRQLLAFARKQTVTPKLLDINDTVSGMFDMLKRLIGEDIELVLLQGADLWPVKIDPSQIDRILVNLCVNSRDLIPGTGRVIIETGNITINENYCADHLDSVPGDYVLISVSDDGCGMEPSVLEHLFEPFFTTKDIGHGTGLGLASIYGIVRQNEGFINVYSEPDKGSTFKIYLPRFAGKDVEKVSSNISKAPRGNGEMVILVEDEKTMLNLIKSMLEKLGYLVMAANTPDEAISMSEQYGGDIHLLITDVIMPGMNGRELSECLRKNRPVIKCLFMSGYTADVITNRGVMDEGVNFIQKPFFIKDIASKIRDVLEQK